MKTARLDAALLSAIVAACYLLKRFYAQAGAEDLTFILRPTAAVLELALGTAFTWERHAGFESRELSLVIVPACAGINFWIIAFFMLSAGFLRRFRAVVAKVAWLAGSAVASFAATILVNAVRIGSGASHATVTTLTSSLSPAQAHRIEGVVVYLSALYLLYSCSDAALSKASGRRSTARLVVPLACYLTGTLLVPIANGSIARPGFFHHAVSTAAVAAALSLLLVGASVSLRCFCTAGPRSRPG